MRRKVTKQMLAAGLTVIMLFSALFPVNAFALGGQGNIGLYGTTTVAEAVSGYDASMLLSVLLYLIPTAFLLRRKKLPEVQLYWHQYVKK